MNLTRASAAFRKNPVQDAYTGEELTKAQLGVFSDALRDGVTTQRRWLDCNPTFDRPIRGVVIVGGSTFILGTEAVDLFAGSPTRKKFVLHASDGVARVSSLYELLVSAAPLEAHAGRIWMKGTAEVAESSARINQVEIFFAASESVQAGQVIELVGSSYFVRHVFLSAAGYLAAVCDELAAPVLETGSLVGGVWNRVTQKNEDTLTPIDAVRLRWQTDYEYLSQATEKFKAGDDVAVVLDSAVKAGFKVRFGDGDWTVLATRPTGPINYLHLRRP